MMRALQLGSGCSKRYRLCAVGAELQQHLKLLISSALSHVSALLFCLFLIFTGTNSAHAVSTGCIAVRGGALTTGGIDVNFNGNFEAGETVVWTFSGGGADEASVTPPGGLLPVVGRVATFTFPATGAFLIAETGGSAITATCNETTVEKQAAVKNAVKTLTEMQLIQSLAFQGQLLTELTGLFLSGALPAITLERLEQQLVTFEQRRARLNNEAVSLRRTINSAPASISRNLREIESLKYITKKDRLYDSPLYTLRKTCWGCGAVKESFAHLINSNITSRRNRIKRLKFDHAEIIRRKSLLPILIWDGVAEVKRLRAEVLAHEIHIENTVDDYKETRRQKNLLFERYFGVRGGVGLIPNAEARLAKARSDLATGSARLKAAELAIRRNTKEISDYEALRNGRNAKVARLNANIAAVNQRTAAAQRRLADIPDELSPLNSSIARIQSEMTTLRARVGQPAAQFARISATSNLQGLLPHQQVSDLGTPNPLGLSSSVTNNISFFTDTNTLRSLQNILNPKYNFWAKGDFSDFDSDQPGADRNGQAYSFATGAYYAPNARWMIGAMYRFRHSDSSSVAQASNVSTRGHGVGLYSTLVLSETLSMSGQVLYERSSNELVRNGVSGSFDANQFVASGTLQGTFNYESFWLRPSAGLTYAHVDQDTFTDSTGTRIAGQVTEQGQFTFGPTIGYRLHQPDEFITFLEPSLSVAGVWTFLDEGDTTLASGTIIEQDNLTLQLNAGLSMTFSTGAKLSLNAGYAGLGDGNVETLSGGLKLSVPF